MQYLTVKLYKKNNLKLIYVKNTNLKLNFNIKNKCVNQFYCVDNNNEKHNNLHYKKIKNK